MDQPTTITQDVGFQGNEDIVPAKRKSRAKPKPTGAELPVPALTDIIAIATHWTSQFPDLGQIVVNSLEDYTRAAAVEAAVGDAIKAIEEGRLKETRPYDAVKAKIKALADDQKARVETLYMAVKRARAVWKTREDARLAFDAAQEAARHEAVVVQHAATTGRPIEEIRAVIPTPPAPLPVPTTVATPDGGTLGSRRVPKWEITNIFAIPWEYGGVCLYVVNEAAIVKLRAQAGEDLTKCPPGVRFFYDETSVRRAGAP